MNSVRRGWLIFGVLVLVAVLLPVGFYAEENWRGARAWTAAKRDLQSRGENLAWQAFIPPPVPDDRNLAMADLFMRELNYRSVTGKPGVFTLSRRAKRDAIYAIPHSYWRDDLALARCDTAAHANLSAYQRFFWTKTTLLSDKEPAQSPAVDVLRALLNYAPLLDELSLAVAGRPDVRFPLDFERADVKGILLPQYALERQFIIVLSLRATARLAESQTDAALHDVQLALRLARGMEADPFALGHSEQCRSLQIILGVIWEGLAARRWSPAQLADLQENLPRFDMLAGYVHAVRCERAAILSSYDWLKRQQNLFTLDMTATNPPTDPRMLMAARLAGRLIPSGWFDLNRAGYARGMQGYVEAVDRQKHRFHLARLQETAGAFDKMPKSPGNLLARIAGSWLDDFALDFARIQTGLDQAVIACALERYFFDRQTYPSNLGELIPAYLTAVPTDVIDGAPMRYHLTPDGRFQLYGVGFNEKDDGGKVVFRPGGKPDNRKGDWIWQYVESRAPDNPGRLSPAPQPGLGRP